MTGDPRYALVELERGALLLDLRTGSLLRLNPSAAFVWRHHLAGEEMDAIAGLLADRFRLPQAAAIRDAELALEIPALAESPPAASELHYERSLDRYLYLRAGQPIFAIDDGGTTIALEPEVNLSRAELRLFLKNVATKVMSLRGHTVLHASAAAIGGTLIAFAGESGAGKTTTARALVRAGARAVAEDKVVLRPEGGHVHVSLNGETSIHEWAARAADEMAVERATSGAPLDLVTEGPTLPLSEIGFLDVNRRRRGPIGARRTDAVEGAGLIFQRAFLGSDLASDWIRQLRTSAAIAQASPAYELEMPDDLVALDEEARGIVSRAALGARSVAS